jgi:hypothetical protein
MLTTYPHCSEIQLLVFLVSWIESLQHKDPGYWDPKHVSLNSSLTNTCGNIKNNNFNNNKTLSVVRVTKNYACLKIFFEKDELA